MVNIGITFIASIFTIGSTLASLIDVFGVTNGHEPRVAINCGKVPFYIDLKTGEWVADSEGIQRCDGDKEEVKSYCSKIYPNLNITNIVEANNKIEFTTWCAPGSKQCDGVKKVNPYRCLVNEYEADALMVPDGCKFDHIHDQNLCMSHEQWREHAQESCKDKYKMKLKDFGILLSCKTDLFTGVEFVCCPKAVMKEMKKQRKQKKIITLPTEQELPKVEVDRDLFSAAIRTFQKYLPMETKGCDRTTYITRQSEMEDRHRNQIAAVVDEWDEAEKRYNELKLKDPVAAEEKMKRTLEVFRETLAALEEESKQEKNRLRAEHADCINIQINKSKRDAMLSYLSAIEEEPVNAEKILKAVRKFIQVCEHDRVHSLRHFEHIRNRDAEKAETLRGELLTHLKDLNKVVNESMALLNYLPEIAQQFGINGGSVILKPRSEMPEEEHSHDRVDEILKHATKNYGSKKATAVPVDKIVPIDAEPIVDPTAMLVDPTEMPAEKIYEPMIVKKIQPPKIMDNFENDDWMKESDDVLDQVEDNKPRKFVNPFGSDGLIVDPVPTSRENVDDDDEEDEEDKRVKISAGLRPHKHQKKSPYAITAILGLSCGILVIMLFVVIAMIVRRRRLNVTRVVLSEHGDDREHLVQMQKSGFENPTYKFFYY